MITQSPRLPHARWPSACSRLLRIGSLFLGLSAFAAAQDVDPAPSDLARYDRNHDGRLDENERAAERADEARAGQAVGTTSPTATADQLIKMSPFEVVDDRRGYYASNTMSGTRVNSKLEDLGSAITVVTKDEMNDFAMLDINDIFAYQASTEGSLNYTDYEVNQSSQPQDNLQSSPNTANRIRGLSSANVAYGGFETSRRVPIDPIMTDAVEISRGPNSNLFGLGTAGGTVNTVPASANLTRDRAQIQLRVDSFGRLDGEMGERESVDINRVLFKNKLAIRASQVFQDTAFTRQPSGVKTERYNAMVKYRPFANTTLSASFQHYHDYGRRPNSITPRDSISKWLDAGSPTWDPLTNTTYVNGSPVDKNLQPTTKLGGGIPTVGGAPLFNSGYQTTGRGTSLLYIDPAGVGFWTAPRGTSTQDALLTTKASNNQTGVNYALLNPQTLRKTQPLWNSDAAVSDKAMYDWSSINIAAMNHFDETVDTSLVTLDQVFFETPRQLLAAQAGWFRENSPKYYHDFPTGSAGSTYLMIDVNQRRLDGTPNPYFLRPYVGITEVNVIDQPLLNDTYRAQLAYQLNLTHEKNWLRWLGMHTLTGYGEYKHDERRSYYSQLAMLDNHAWLPAGTPRATSKAIPDGLPQDGASPTGSRSFRFYYVGDNVGHNVDYAPFAGSLDGVYDYTWGNFATQQANHEPTRLGLAGSVNGTGGVQNSLKFQKTEGGVLQSHFFDDRLVTTFGLRKDKVYTKEGVNARLLPDAMTPDYGWDRQWADGDYTSNHGLTRTSGAVLKLTRWFSIFANKSDSFIPADAAINLHGKYLPNPQGKGQDWGFNLTLFHGKLNIRADQYFVRTANDRSGNSSTLATRAVKMDVFDGQLARNFSLDMRAREWLQATQPGLTGTALDAAVAKEMQIDPALLAQLQSSVNFGGLPISEAQDALSKGKELEINYNPTNYWTMKANLTETETIQSAVAQDLLDYLSERGAVWESIKDKQTGLAWYTSSYDGGTTPMAYLPANVTKALGIAEQTVGKSLPQVRKYHANFQTNFYLKGITDVRFLRNVNVGGALRWEDKGAIGYYGVQQLPDVITDLDRNRPIYDKSHLYVDLLAGYRTRIFSDKVGMTVQFNIRNVQEGGRLQPIAAFPDGTPSAYRIIDPRQFILSVSFEL